MKLAKSKQSLLVLDCQQRVLMLCIQVISCVLYTLLKQLLHITSFKLVFSKISKKFDLEIGVMANFVVALQQLTPRTSNGPRPDDGTAYRMQKVIKTFVRA
jgi:hypothetical protein